MKFISIKIILGAILLLISLTFSSCSSTKKAQASQTSQNDEQSEQIFEIPTTSEEKIDESIFTVVEEPASYPDGGMDGFYKYVSKNMVYPEEAKKMKIEGRVFVVFVVDKEGKITNIQTVRGIGGGCDEEAERLLRECQNWIPAKQRGNPVKVRMNIPIMFKLNK
ncbi:energy transducer TonB [Bernardetia sp. Wsw4-3y2]|uniref:energy transducer TonB n=1 Tax=Bernardetia sp. Wsw4-3y2 TaxID=3127471 RepID=UPI0030CAC713